LLSLTTSEERDLDFGEGFGQPDTLRLWVSDRQWLAMLQRIEQGSEDGFAGGGSDASGEREHERVAGDFRCMIRLGNPERVEDDHGTYVVRTRNVGGGGIGFIHSRELRPGVRCTVALQPASGPGLVLGGRVAWCRPVERTGEDPVDFQVGVQFDQPVDLDGFVHAA
jgi:hypothetical protein